ncbi:adenylate/guanylate cyclase domain-containing protein [Catenovulum sp. SM1970]|uniref:CHASE2 domain-containing protein n=1 Tax=Marinifaba aquimaris TaxID=2741323 RepID=UPI0015741E16|nr:adenylate/guanylate cyclase domain-containing protein [Marinifaba aquimaris]NTS75725.1 adenylate/guanylate cyclase domain-containing protein [Marinifaba aquimaris]
MRINWLGKRQIAGLFLVLSLVFIQLAPPNSAVKGVLERLDGLLYDARLKLSLHLRPEYTDPKIVIVDLDEASFKVEGRWPWSRAKTATLVENLLDAGAIVIGFDVLFSEPELNPLNQLEAYFPNHNDETWLAVKQQVDPDSRFAASIAQGDVVLGALFEQDAAYTNGIPPVSIVAVQTEVDQARITALPFDGYIGSVDTFKPSAQGEGFINSVPDRDGFIRRAALFVQYQEQLYPSLALEVARIYSLADEIKVNVEPYQGWYHLLSLNFNGQNIETDQHGRVIVPYRGPRNSFPYISATDVLQQNIPQDLLTDAIVLVGTSAVGLADLRATPVGIQYPGVEIHANVIEGLLNPDLFSFQPDMADWLIVSYLLLFGVIMALVMPGLGPKKMAFWGSCLLMISLLINYHLWTQAKLSLPLTTVILLCVLLSLMNIAVGFFNESSQRKRIKGMFDQYVPPAHIDKMLASPDSISLAGERKTLSVLFSDIRGFTDLSENMSANDLKLYLNRYFSPITKTILSYQGTIDKYVGDMVMAFWGAPIDDPKHATNAIQTAFKMLEVTENLNQELIKEDLPAIAIGIGINSGEMNVGDMGSEFRRAYTVLGDAVNLASRLESLTKFYGVEILVGENTKQLAQDTYEFMLVDQVKVKGKDIATKVYQPLAEKKELTDSQKLELEQYSKAYQAYLEQDWHSAEIEFNKLSDNYPGTKLYNLYKERICQLKQADISEHWNGVFIHTEK